MVLVSLQLQAETSLDDLKNELAELRQIVIAQQEQINRLSQELEERQTEVVQAPATRTTAPVAPSTPAVMMPQMAPKTQKGFNAELYGFIKLDASYDTQKTAAGNLAFFVLPESNDGSDDEFNMTAKESRLGLNLSSGDMLPVETKAKLEMDFYGSSSETSASPRMRQAYLQFKAGDWDILAGQTWDATQSILPKTLNFATGGRHGTLWARRPQVRFTRNVETDSGKWIISAALARTVGSDLDGLGQEDGKDFALPPNMNGKKGLVALAGHYGTETIDTVLENDARDYHSHMLSASLLLPLTDKLDLKTVVWTGQNLSGVQGGIGQGINLVKDTEIAATGGWVQFGYKASDKVSTFLTYGIDDPDDDDLNFGQRSKNQNISASAYWNFSNNLTWAFEYSHMKTEYLFSDDASNNRFQSSLILVF